MLTSKSNFNTLREVKGKQVTDEMLKQLYDNCTSKDFINLNGNISKGYPAEIANFIMQKIDVTKADKIKILVINDLSFHMYNCLTNAGILHKNITLAFGKWNKDGTPLNDKKVYNIMSMFAKSNFVEFEHDASNIVTLEEIMNMKNKNMKFDYIISNPPYEIGNAITKSVIDNVQFDNFINLMPVSDYKKDGLYKHITAIELIDPAYFEDANVQRNLCLSTLTKTALENSFDELLTSTYDSKFRSFYILNMRCTTNNFEVGPIMTKLTKAKEEYSQETDFYITVRTSADGVHKLDGKASADKDWNLKLVPKDVMWNRIEWVIKGQPIGITGMMIFFSNSVSKDHFTTFRYKTHNE